MKRNASSFGRIIGTCAALLAGGSVFGACDMRFKDAFVQGSESFVLSSLLNPNSSGFLLAGTFLDPCTFTDCPGQDSSTSGSGGAGGAGGQPPGV